MGNRQTRKNVTEKGNVCNDKDSQSKSLKSTTAPATAPATTTKTTQKQPTPSSTNTSPTPSSTDSTTETSLTISSTSKTSSKTSSIDIIDNPKDRLLMVTFGFIRRSVDTNRFNQIPIVLIELCSKYIFEIGPNDICINFFKYYYHYCSIPMAIELSLDDKKDSDKNFVNKIFDNTLIKKYQINYIKIERDERNQVSKNSNSDKNKKFIEKKTESGLLNTVTTPLSCINDSKCYAFTFRRVIDRGSRGDMLVQVNAMDEKDCIILSSKWRKMNANVSSVMHMFEEYNHEAVEKYWNEKIVDNNNDRYKMEKKNENCVVINEWVHAMKRLGIISNENNARLIFWFILFNNKSSLNEMKVEDLKRFLFDGSYQEYSQRFFYPIAQFRRVIPNFLENT